MAQTQICQLIILFLLTIKVFVCSGLPAGPKSMHCISIQMKCDDARVHLNGSKFVLAWAGVIWLAPQPHTIFWHFAINPINKLFPATIQIQMIEFHIFIDWFHLISSGSGLLFFFSLCASFCVNKSGACQSQMKQLNELGVNFYIQTHTKFHFSWCSMQY